MGGNGLELGKEQAIAGLDGQPLQKGIQGTRQRRDLRTGGQLMLNDRPVQAGSEHILGCLPEQRDGCDDLPFTFGDVDSGEYHHASAGGVGRKQDSGGSVKIPGYSPVYVRLHKKLLVWGSPVFTLIVPDGLDEQ